MTKEAKARILIAEDESIVATDIEEGLRSAGYEVVGPAASGHDAVALVEKFLPDLTIMDIRLQGKMTGIEAANEIRTNFGIPVIYLTAHSDEVTIQQAKITQPFGYLLKPFGQRELRAAIETALYKSQAERKLAETAHWNCLIIETAHSAFVAMDSDGIIVDWNPRAEAIFGWKRNEAMGKRVAETIIPENLRQAHYRGLDRYLKTGEAPVLNRVLELRALHKAGHEFPIELTISTTLVDGKARFLSFIQDITERKRFEREEKHREELERSNQELERFAHITSHDLQEPLRTISMYTELLASRLGPHLGPLEKEFVGHVLTGANKMRDLIDDLLAYSRVDSRNETESEFERVDVGRVLDTVLEDLQATISKNGAQITHEPLPVVLGHSNQVGLLLQNLIANAIKFRQEGPPVIEVSAQREGEYWHFHVKDNGIGFEQKYAEHIFDMFKRLSGADQYPGTGIGLAICKKVVALHGGRIWAESSLGKGATFHFTLPAADLSAQRDHVGVGASRRGGAAA